MDVAVIKKALLTGIKSIGRAYNTLKVGKV
jgi:hypothetical protein